MKIQHIISEELIDTALLQMLNDKCWVIYNSASALLNKTDVHFFKTRWEAKDFFQSNGDASGNYKIVYAVSVLDLINRLSYGESIDWRLLKIDQSIKTNVMNEQNYQYLKDNVKYLGFGEGLDEVLKNNMQKGLPGFSLSYSAEMNRKPFTAELHFRKSDSTDLYFLNSYSATLKRSDGEKIDHDFYLSNGKGVTAKEAYNLLEGRAVYKELSNREGERYKAWLQIDFGVKDKNGNYEMKQYHQNYGYDIKAAVSKLSITELKDPEKEKALLQSLQKGNLQAVSIGNDVGVSKMFIEANPQYKTVNLYDANLKRVAREDMGQYLQVAPSGEKEVKNGQAQSVDRNIDKKKGLNGEGEEPGGTKNSPKGKSMRA